MSDSERSEVSMEISEEEEEDEEEEEEEESDKAPPVSALFTDDKEAYNVSRRPPTKLPKGLDAELLNSVSVSSRQMLAQMMTHPRKDEFLVDAYVRYRTVNGVTLARVRGTTTSAPYRVEGETCTLALKVQVLVRASTGETEAEERTVRADEVEEDSLSSSDVANFFGLLERLPRGGSGHLRVESLPVLMQAKARQLAEFAFTERDVEEILRRRQGQDVTSKDLYMRRADLEVELSMLKSQKVSKKHSNRQRIAQLEGELAEIISKMGPVSPQQSRKRAPVVDLVAVKKKPATAENPFARRECRPTVMWATTENKTAAANKTRAANAAAAELGVLPLSVQHRFLSDVIAWRASMAVLDDELLDRIRKA